MSVSLSYTTAEGTNLPTRNLGFLARAVTVDNYSASWCYVPGGDRFVPPFTYAAIVALQHGAMNADLQWRTPAAITPTTPGNGSCTAVYTDEALSPSQGIQVSSGLPVVTPINGTVDVTSDQTQLTNEWSWVWEEDAPNSTVASKMASAPNQGTVSRARYIDAISICVWPVAANNVLSGVHVQLINVTPQMLINLPSVVIKSGVSGAAVRDLVFPAPLDLGAANGGNGDLWDPWIDQASGATLGVSVTIYGRFSVT